MILNLTEDFVAVLNTYTGSLCRLNRDSYKAMTQCDSSHSDFRAMVEQGLLVNSNTDEFRRVMCEYEKYVSNEEPELLQFTIAMTTACNLRCMYCFENKPTVTMDNAAMDGIVNYVTRILREHPGIKRFHVTWFGGEPLLDFNKLITMSDKFISICSKLDIQYRSVIITNGILLTTERVVQLKDHGINAAQITLDGSPEDCARLKKGSISAFSDLMNRLPQIAKHLNIRIRLNTCVENQEGVIRAFNTLTELGSEMPYNLVYFSRIEDYSNDMSGCTVMKMPLFNEMIAECHKEAIARGVSWRKLSRFPKRRKAYCGSMQKLSHTVGPRGEIYVCEHCIGANEHVIGNVFNGTLNDEKRNRFIYKPLMKKCEGCNLLPMCLGGCPANRLLHDLPMDCDSFRKTVEYEVLMWLKAQEAQKGH